ncbi:MAG TPA: phosphatase domain-containing protein [Gemmatimonadaceae bacterium]|nr:phosphatase domain-containing protein [Gemmatimonadaceae bacterium]
MRNWIGTAVRLVARLEATVDRVRFGATDEVRDARVVPYDGYGTATSLLVLGRVLRNAPLRPSREDASLWQNLVDTYRRFETDEVPHARVRVAAGGAAREATADAEGHLAVRLVLDTPLPAGRQWHDVAYTLLSPVPVDAPAVVTGRVLVPADTAGFGVISDIDDTVVRTDVRQVARMARTVLFGNARTRLPFPGVAAFYRALAAGFAGAGPNPLFYVSSSPWNLHDLLVEFLDLQGIPRGPLLLRDWGIQAHELLPTAHGAHKQAAIRRILAEYPSLPFILMGDSGQEDPEIYASIVHDHPQRVLAIYIRDVTRDAARTDAIRRLAAEVERAGCSLTLSEDTVGAARHAAEHGWIAAETLREIAGEAEADDPGGTPAPPVVVE